MPATPLFVTLSLVSGVLTPWCPCGIKFQRHSWGLASQSLMGEHEQVVCGRWGWKGVGSIAGTGFKARRGGAYPNDPAPPPKNSPGRNS